MKYAFFTGATGGLGSLCVKALSESHDWTVFAAGTNAAALEKLGALDRVIPVRVDITKQVEIDEAYKVVRTHTETLDAVIHFAGVSGFVSLTEGDYVPVVEKYLAVNLMSAVRVNKIFMEMIIKSHGRIIHCSSESGWMTPQPFSGPYGMSKYALEAYNDSLRRELMFIHIPVVKIQPGSYKTSLTQDIYDGFDRVIGETAYYRKTLTRMKPLMMNELRHDNNPQKLVKALMRAVSAKHPKIRYRVGTGKLLVLLEFFPDSWVDGIYRLLAGR
jgi:NAD(P)-dependent dehydrogenase (short-subunit alcohol dehydrogenase family)